MKSYEKLLLENKAWAEERVMLDADYFKRLAKVQKPEFLWIGCADSRVPANEITNAEPGEIFVHRNIANLVFTNDLNLLSVLEYAVLVLRVKHVIVCGHYGCGGVRASMQPQTLESIDKWLQNLRDTYELNHERLERIENLDLRADLLTELSVEEQVKNLSKIPIVQKAWSEWNQPVLHGWVYRLSDGILNPISRIDPQTSPISDRLVDSLPDQKKI